MMVRSILALILLIPFYVNAQTGQGNIYTNGSTSFTKKSQGKGSIKTIEYSLHAGYFLIENFLISTGYSRSSVKYNFGVGGDPILLPPSEFKSSSFNFYGRYYIYGAFIGSGYRNVKNEMDRYKYVTFHSGYAFFFNDFVALEPVLNYNISINEDAEDFLSFHLGIGLYIMTGKGKEKN